MNAIRFALLTLAGLALCACSGAVDSPGAADAAALGDAVTTDTKTADAGYYGAVVHSCAELPGHGYIPINCDFEGTCSLGQECCCDECHASTVCTCVDGTASCHATDACYHVICADAEPPPDGPLGLECGALQAQWPQVDLNAGCDFAGSCELGQECCCGQCFPSMVCSCANGNLGCHATDACMVPACPDAAVDNDAAPPAP